MSTSTPAAPTVRREPSTRPLVVAGLAVGAVLGFSGNFVTPGPVQDVMYAVSAVGLIFGAVLLVVEHLTAGRLLPAAGFAMLALGEARLLNPTHAPGGESSFAAGVMLYAPGLVLIALSPWAPRWARVTGAVAAACFAAYSLAYFAGMSVDSSGPLAGAGYALLTLTIVGWILTVTPVRLRKPR